MNSGSRLRIMSFNIRNSRAKDGDHAWPRRRHRVASMIRFHDVQFAGLQEAYWDQVSYLADQLDAYDWFGVGRRDGKREGEFAPIFYERTRFELLEDHTIWLSESPEVPGSRGWDAACRRIVTWGRLGERRTGAELLVFNTHFDHRGERARRESAGLLLEVVGEEAVRRPAVVTGDFNLGPDSEPYRILTGSGPKQGRDGGLHDARVVSIDGHHGPEMTFGGFRWPGEALGDGKRIDYIFVNDRFQVNKHGVLTDIWDEGLASDHFPVVAELELGGGSSPPNG